MHFFFSVCQQVPARELKLWRYFLDGLDGMAASPRTLVVTVRVRAAYADGALTVVPIYSLVTATTIASRQPVAARIKRNVIVYCKRLHGNFHDDVNRGDRILCTYDVMRLERTQSCKKIIH